MTTDICGWFGRFDGASEAVLQRMAGAASERTPRMHEGAGAGLLVDAGYEGGDLFADSRLRAGVFGKPSWSAPDLASLAARDGDAAALVRGFLPQEILDKKKHGFGMPYDLWIRTHPGIRQVLDNVAGFRQRRYCNPGFIDGLMKDSDGGDPRATGRVWDIMMLEMWLRERGLN